MHDCFRPMSNKCFEQTSDDVYLEAYYDSLGRMNRKERRTAYGKLKVAEAEIAALKAKLKFIEDTSDES